MFSSPESSRNVYKDRRKVSHLQVDEARSNASYFKRHFKVYHLSLEETLLSRTSSVSTEALMLDGVFVCACDLPPSEHEAGLRGHTLP